MIDYKNELNSAQYEAATTLDGPVLVIAGAGSGKTRTIVYRLARLLETGIPASSILLLTFTRKAAGEMLGRAQILLQQNASSPEQAGYEQSANTDIPGLAAVQGGTFHSFAYSVLRVFQPEGYAPRLTVMDSHDMTASIQHCKEELKIGKGDRSFPKNQTFLSLLSKSRNKEKNLDDIIAADSSHLLLHAEDMLKISAAYSLHKKNKNLLDYDDLLFELENVLLHNPMALDYCRRRYKYIMIDEYQDTNPVQARIAALVAGLNPGDSSFGGNIMAVGDDAQSIYAFRGADVRNILRFPEVFSGAKIIRLEENYRSTQPLLDLSNAVLENSREGFEKKLFTQREGSAKPVLIKTLSDQSQAEIVAKRIESLLNIYPAHEIAVLFRAGFHSYNLELALNKRSLPFRKFGGIRYSEAAHVKDLMCYARLVLNPLDYTAFIRMAAFNKGVGEKTCSKLYNLAVANDVAGLKKACGRYPELAADLEFVDLERRMQNSPSVLLSNALEHFKPKLELLYPDDFPKRLAGLEQMLDISAGYKDLDLFIADLSLDDRTDEDEKRDCLVLSTIHSAKGLEWAAVIILDLAEDRFPSRHAQAKPDDFEEERRLMYVACTRAKQCLELFAPGSFFDKSAGARVPAVPSPFVRELDRKLYDELQESYLGVLQESRQAKAAPESLFSNSRIFPSMLSTTKQENEMPDSRGETPVPGEPGHATPQQCGFCRHKIFGRGKIVQHLPPDKYRINFPGVGLKVIMAAYLSMED